MKKEIAIKLIQATQNKQKGFNPFKQFCIKDPEKYFKKKGLEKEFDSLSIEEKEIFKDEQLFFKIICEYGFFTPKELYQENNKCLGCGKETKFLGLSRGYRKTCGDLECVNKVRKRDKEFWQKRNEKTNETFIKKYGTHPMKLKETILKQKQTKLEKYGDENYNNKEKNQKTKLERYGNKNYLNRNKAKQTIFERYGVENISKSHLKNLDDFNEEFIKENFIKDDRFLIQEFCEYFNYQYKAGMSKKKELGIIIPNKFNKCKTQQKIFDEIEHENKIFNDKSLISPQEIDILLPDIKLAIEFNGLLYHSRGISKHKQFNSPDFDKNYHIQKTELVEEKGYQLFQIFESDDLDLWKSMINNKLGLNKKIFARKCEIREVDSNTAERFLKENHLQGYCVAKYRFGLYYENVLVSLMTFGKSRYNKNYDWELLRFCSKKGYNIVGGASKLLSHFRKQYSGSIISYANRRWSNGHLYETLGFEEIGKTNPNYFYFKEDDLYKLYFRVTFQKYKLKNLLDVYDENLTETQNMFNNGYRQIFDCGNKIYALK